MLSFAKTRAIVCFAFVCACAANAQQPISGAIAKSATENITPKIAVQKNTEEKNISKNVAEKRRSLIAPALVKSARDAINSGIPSLAEAIAAKSFADQSTPQKESVQMRDILLDALISQGKFEAAEKILASIKEKTPLDKIRMSLVLIGTNKAEEAERIIAELDETDGDKNFSSWFHMAKGYIAFAKNDHNAAIEEFEKAKKDSPSGLIAADAEIAINTCKISRENSKTDTNKLESDLAQKVSLYMGTPMGFQFAKQYAGLLFKLGKIEQAIEVINTQLGIELASSIDKDELRLIGAAINPNIEKRVAELKNILLTCTSSGIAEFALALISRDSKDNSAVQKKFLEELVLKGSPSIRDRILLEISKINIRDKDYKNATIAAKKIIDEYPASEFRSFALRILAWTAFRSDENKASEYRLAASYLTSLAELEKDSEKNVKIKMLAADCLLLNQDYAGAAKIYEECLQVSSSERPLLLDRAVEALLMQDKVKEATELILSSYENKILGEDEVWNAAWRIVSQKKKSGNLYALESIENILKSAKKISPELHIKILWLRARITEDSSNYGTVISLCKEIEKSAKNLKNPNDPSMRTLRANALLMLGRALEKEAMYENKDGAFETYLKLRRDFPETEAAQISYLYEARDLAHLERFNSARNTCVELAEKYPNSKYVYSALFDAAEYSRRMGLDSNYRTALSLLDKLCKQFPDNPRNFYAKISQAEILRLMNAFPDARSMYNDIINTYQSHPEIYTAWMGLGDSTAALPSRSQDAAAIFERLYSLPELPQSARAEAAYKWAFALERAKKLSEANEVRWVTSLEFLKSANIDASTRYWVGRTLFEMAKTLEEAGQIRDARAAYELIVKYKLPSSKIAKMKLKNSRKD